MGGMQCFLFIYFVSAYLVELEPGVAIHENV